MFRYRVLCTHPGCQAEAAFKIASRWSDGTTEELKTYHLACAQCVQALFDDACKRHGLCRLTHGELLEPPTIFEWTVGQRDKELIRRADLENLGGQEQIRQSATTRES